MKKRIFVIIFIVVIAFLSVIGYSYFIEPDLLVTKKLIIETQKPIEPCTMVYFTDTHFGKYYDIIYARKIVEKINEAKPDVVVSGGDLEVAMQYRPPYIISYKNQKTGILTGWGRSTFGQPWRLGKTPPSSFWCCGSGVVKTGKTVPNLCKGFGL